MVPPESTRLRVVRGTQTFSWATPTKRTPSFFFKSLQVLFHDIVLALLFLKFDPVQPFLFDESIDAFDESFGHFHGLLG